MAANQVTVATPGPAGAVGLTYEGVWTDGDVYQVRDCIRFTDGNLYFCNVQHTASSSNTPLLNATYWTLFINADDAFQWATKAKHSAISDSLANTGYSALHQAAKAQDWAKLTTDAVTNDANDADVGYSAKAWAIGGTEVTTTNTRGAAKEWAITTGGFVDTAEYSAKEYAQGAVLAAGGSAKNWAQLATTPSATATDASAKEWATGVSTHKNEGSAKEWAIYTSGDVRGAASGSMSAKEWAVGTQGRGVAGEGSSKDWSTRTGAVVDDAEYSAKEYSQGSVLAAGGSAKNWAQLATTPSTTATDASAKEWATGVSTHKNEGSAKDWAIYTAGDVRGASSGSMSSKEWAVGVLGRGVSSEGSSKDWATRTGATVDDAEYSAKEYALGTTVAVGSAKDWAVLAEDSAVTGSSYSALHHAAKAAASATAAASSATASASSATAAAASETAANASADAASAIFDKFDDKYLGEMADSASQGTNPTPTGTWAKDASAITVSSASNIKVGQVVTGTGIPTSPKPNVISIAGTVVTISDNMAAAGSGVTLTFTGYGIYGDFNGGKDGPALNNDGDALTDGVKYFNTTDDVMLVYDATTSAWKRMQPTTTEQGHINTVSGIQANVTTVAGISANVTTVAGISANVTTVAGISANVTTVVGISANVTTVAGISANVTTVAGVHANVTTVAGSIANVNTVATNMATVNDFADKYRIASSAPGSSNDEGDLYYNTSSNSLHYYDGSAWQSFGVTLSTVQAEASNAAVAMSIALG